MRVYVRVIMRARAIKRVEASEPRDERPARPSMTKVLVPSRIRSRDCDVASAHREESGKETKIEVLKILYYQKMLQVSCSLSACFWAARSLLPAACRWTSLEAALRQRRRGRPRAGGGLGAASSAPAARPCCCGTRRATAPLRAETSPGCFQRHLSAVRQLA